MKSNSTERIESVVGTVSPWLRARRAACRTCVEPLERRRLLAMVTIDLGTLGANSVSTPYDEATDINASAQVVGTSDGRAFLWQKGVMTDLGTLGGSYSRAFGLNDLGQVVGQSASSTLGSRAFLVTPEDTDGNGTPDRWFRDTNADGKNDLMRDLGTLGSTYTEAIAYDVNNSGQVVGFSGIVYPRVPAQHAFRWQNGVMTDLGTFGGTLSVAKTINDAGQIAGSFYTSGASHAFLWKNGVATDLGISNGVNDINGSGRLVDASRVWTPTVPNGSSGTFATLGQLPQSDQDPTHLIGIETDAQSINSAGHVVGNQLETIYTDWAGNSTGSRAVRWINGVPEELPLQMATAINDAGQIVGRSGAYIVLVTEESLVMPLLWISHATVTEGNSGSTNAEFTVHLSRPGSQTVTVDYGTADYLATAGSDYIPTSGTLTFTPGQTIKTVSVQVLGDRVAEEESFSVELSNASNAILPRSSATAYGVILDDEPRITGGGTVIEGHSGSTVAMVTLTLSNANEEPVSVDYATGDDTATAGSDYVATSGTVTFAPGQTTRQFSVTILDDRVREYDERVAIILSNPSTNAAVASYFGVLVIQDDEPLISIPGGVSVSEGNAGTTDAVFTVSLSAPYDQDVTVEYVTYDGDSYYYPGDAHAGSDYVATSGTLRIPAGQTSGTVRVPVVGDTLDENDEYFYLVLANPSANALLDDYSSYGLGQIRDDDGPAKTWVGPASGGNWSTAANWSPAGVPTADEHVAIAGQSVTLAGSTYVASLSLTGGATLTVAANGNRVLRASALSVAAGSSLDLADNKMILDYSGVSPIGVWTGSAYDGVTGMIQSGRITSSLASGNFKTLGVAEAREALNITGSQTGTFAGEVVDSTAVLVKFTWGGDANLDGKINIDDYGRIDDSVAQSGVVFGWFNGDFNYDGKINIDDYGIIDGNISQ